MRHPLLRFPLLVFLSLTSSFALPLASQGQDQAAVSEGRKPLKAEVQHNERLPSLPENQQVGNHIDPDQLTALTPDNMWYPIPKWLAGKWHSESMTVTSVTDCRSGVSEQRHVVRKEVADTTHGQQRDKTDQIWDFVKIPRVHKVAVDAGTGYLRATREDVLQSDASAVVVKILNSQITVDNEQKVVESQQVEQISTFRPMEDGLVQIEASLKNFDAAGTPLQIQSAEKMVKRIAPYEDIQSDGDLNLKQLFVEFLKKTGRQDLLPDGA